MLVLLMAQLPTRASVIVRPVLPILMPPVAVVSPEAVSVRVLVVLVPVGMVVVVMAVPATRDFAVVRRVLSILMPPFGVAAPEAVSVVTVVPARVEMPVTPRVLLI